MATDDRPSQPTTYIPSYPYSDKRLLETPRVHVPPPNLDYHNGKPSFHVSGLLFEQTTEEYGNPDFLKALTLHQKLDMTHTMLSWQYEMRRTAQAILPFLFLGPSSAARDVHLLENRGITLLVAVRSAKAVQARPTFLDPAGFAASAGIQTLAFDFETYDFIPKLRPVIRTINNHLEFSCRHSPIDSIADIGGRVLIFCESGNDRSAVLVAAYLMIVYGVGAVAAIHVIQSQRFCITMSDDMKNILLGFQEIISAERQVFQERSEADANIVLSNHPRTSTGHVQRRTKRNIDEFFHPEEILSDDRLDENCTTVREGTAPFTDLVE